MERIKTWLTHNTVLKLISLLLGFLVWIVVVNTSNPKVSGSVSVSFDVLNEQDASSTSELYTLNYSSVTVSYDVRTKYKPGINANSFSAYVDMNDYSEETGELPVYLEIDSSVSDLIANIRVEPSSVHVYKEKIQQKKFAVQYEVIGQVASGYALGDISITPEYTYIKGPISIMGQISSVGITIIAEGLTETIEGTSTIEFYDANGNILEGIEDSLSFAGDITYTAPVYRIKSLTVNAFTGGAPASGYAVDSVETSPTFISVYGPEELLAEHSYILIPSAELNISGITENKTFNISAGDYIPEGLTLVEPQTEITILVKIKSILKDTSVGMTETGGSAGSAPEKHHEASPAGPVAEEAPGQESNEETQESVEAEVTEAESEAEQTESLPEDESEDMSQSMEESREPESEASGESTEGDGSQGTSEGANTDESTGSAGDQ